MKYEVKLSKEDQASARYAFPTETPERAYIMFAVGREGFDPEKFSGRNVPNSQGETT